MSVRLAHLLPPLAILLVALVVWLPTIGWGLPSRDVDRFLFGDRTPWTGAELIALTATTQPTTIRGADVDADPILDRSKPVVLNDTDAKRAAIVRRYRLMSGQPDEFIQFKALSEMAGRSGLAKLDPRLYQYGGLWMYPVGALVRGAMLVGAIPAPPAGANAMAFYLDHPEAFGRFYVVARLYSLAFGLVAALAIYWLARRVTDHRGLATLASVAFMLLPVVRTATHEAKPHLAGAALCLCAVIAATKFVETGRRRWAIAAGALCGAAMAMVVSMVLSLAILPAMVWLRKRAPRLVAGSDDVDRRANPRQVAGLSLLVIATALFVYVATNPFVLINAVAHPEILRSNLGNSTAMYSPRSDGLQAVFSSVSILSAGLTQTGFWLMLGVLIAATVDAITRRRLSVPSILLLAPTSLVVAQFALLCAGKPAEYARFSLLPVAAICVAAAWRLRKGARGETLVCMLILLFLGLFLDLDRFGEMKRRGEPELAAERLQGASIVQLNWPPAPWSCPPVDLFNNRIVLVDLASVPDMKEPPPPNTARIYPMNLASQIGRGAIRESLDWRDNRFGSIDDIRRGQ